jgi:hypothetical protein
MGYLVTQRAVLQWRINQLSTRPLPILVLY